MSSKKPKLVIKLEGIDVVVYENNVTNTHLLEAIGCLTHILAGAECDAGQSSRNDVKEYCGAVIDKAFDLIEGDKNVRTS